MKSITNRELEILFPHKIQREIFIKACDLVIDESETTNIPIGYEFNWHEREKVNSFFADIKRQGFKVIK